MNSHAHPIRVLLQAAVAWLLIWTAGCRSTPPSNSSTGSSAGGPSEAATTGDGKAGELRVGLHDRLPPLVYVRDGQLVGVEPELARGLAESLGRRIRFVTLPWDDLLPSLNQGRVDIVMSGLSITPARQAQVAFCDPWLRGGQSALAQRAEAAKLRLGLMQGRYRVGAQRGTTGEYFVQQVLIQAEYKAYRTPDEGAKAVMDGKIDAFISDLPVNMWLASTGESSGLVVLDTLLTDEYLAWAVRRDDAALRQAANQYLATIRGSGSLEQTVRRWMPTYLPSANPAR